MTNNQSLKEELEAILKVSYKEYRKKIVNIIFGDKEFFENNLKNLYYANLHLEEKHKKSKLIEVEDDIRDTKKIKRNNIYMIIFMTILLFLLLFTYAKSAGKSTTAIGLYILLIGRSIIKYNNARSEINDLVKKIKDPTWKVKSEIDIKVRRFLDDSIDSFKKFDYGNAIISLTTILDEDKTIPEIHWFRGLVYEKNNMEKESKSDYENAIILNPKFEKNENEFIKYLVNQT